MPAAGQDDTARLASLKRRGRRLAVLSAVLPLLGIGALLLAPLTNDGWTVLVGCVFAGYVASVACGFAALLGMRWWGYDRVWMPASLGTALSLFMLAMAYSSHIETSAFGR